MATHNGATSGVSVAFDRFAITPPLSATLPKEAITRVNAGGPQYTDLAGNVWSADTGLFSPSGAPAEGTGTPEIVGTDDDTLYRSYRGRPRTGTVPLVEREITYNLPISQSQLVDVRLHFAELFWGVPGGGSGGAGSRVFDVYAEGVLVLNDFDITAAAGGGRTAIAVPLEDISVTDGALTLRFKAEIDFPAISAIEVFKQPGSVNLPPTPNAGADRFVAPGSNVTLTGLGGDPDGNTPLAYLWRQTGGSPTVTLSGSGTNRTFVAPSASTVLTFTYTITDSLGAAASDSVRITVDFGSVSGVTLTSSSPTSNPRLVNQTVFFTATVATGAGIGYSWEFGDGTTKTTSGPTTTHVYSAAGTYTAQVTATNPNNSASASTTVKIEQPTVSFARINAGGPALTTVTGAWSANTYVSGGSSATYNGTGEIRNTLEEDLYKTFRQAGTSGTSNFSYNVPVVNGQYRVKLHFIETTKTAANQRRFNVNIEGGANELTNFDIFQESGGLLFALVKPFDVTVTDGTLNIVFTNANRDRAVVSAIEVLQLTDNARPVATAPVDRTVDVGTSQTLAGSASDPDGDLPLTYGWRQTAGTPVTLNNATSASTSFTAPSTPGALTFSFVVTDSRGLASLADTVVVTVRDRTITGLNATSNSPTPLGRTTFFTATTTAGSNVVYTWNLGDGTTKTGANVSHVYATSGTFNVTVTAANGRNSLTTNLSVVVSNGGPVVNAGPDQEVTARTPVTLSGSASDPDTPLTYSWAQTGGPSVSLSGDNTATATFNAPSTPTVLTFTLTVSDKFNASNSDTVVVRVVDSSVSGLSANSSSPTVLGDTTFFTATASGSNLSYSWNLGDGTLKSGASVSHSYAAEGSYTAIVTATNSRGSASRSLIVLITNAAPVVNAGADQIAFVGENVALAASASDPDGHTPLSYSWQQTGGPTVTLIGDNTLSPSFDAPSTPSVLTFTLTVADSFGKESSDTVVVSVRDVPVSGLSANSSSPTVLGGTTFFTATASGSNLSYSWNLGDGTLKSGASVSHSYAAEGVYTATVTASNAGSNQSRSITVLVTNVAPNASAGADRTVFVSDNVDLAGSAGDPDGHLPLSYSWQQTGGPTVSLSAADTLTPGFTAPGTPVVLEFTLIVTDSFGKASSDTVKVTVIDTNVEGVFAGSSSPTVLGQPTSFSATASGSNLSYSWDFGDGTTVNGANLSHTYAAAGVYTATVTVRNNEGERSTTTVVTVTNDTPTVNAGADQVVVVASTVVLNGTASDADGHLPLSYNWQQTGGPSVVLAGLIRRGRRSPHRPPPPSGPSPLLGAMPSARTAATA
ncbi:PKD domain-containing protein [Candidatus Gracilibacteria bacterium]|nr:PKD domain-containing protein [Candidatus Gracilibacteria bacterium]